MKAIFRLFYCFQTRIIPIGAIIMLIIPLVVPYFSALMIIGPHIATN